MFCRLARSIVRRATRLVGSQSTVLLCGVLIAVNVAWAGALAVSAATYNAVDDFSLIGNPNGAWSYGTLSSFTGGTFTLYNVGQAFSDYSVWGNGGTYPNSAGVYNSTPPSGMLHLDGENFISDVRWVAPSAGTYDVAGYFQRVDPAGVPVSVRIIENGTTTLFALDGFTTYNVPQEFNLSNLTLSAGATLDFAEGAPQPWNDSTGLAATITAVPEPSVFVLLGVGVIGLLFRGWRRM
jgi:hypothetical protein